jgi:hypothetical protein
MGDRNQLRDVADWLEPFDQTAVDIYAARTGQEPKAIAKMLDKETWIGGSDAVAQGFADSLLASDEVKTQANNSAARTSLTAIHRVDALLLKAGATKSERRDLIAALKGGMSGAAPTGMSGAAVEDEIQQILATLQSL